VGVKRFTDLLPRFIAEEGFSIEWLLVNLTNDVAFN